MDELIPFGELLRRYRTAAELTQEDLAERAGLSRDAISTLERGLRQHPQRHTVRQLAQALALSAQELAALQAALRRRSTGATPAGLDLSAPPPGRPAQPLAGRGRELALLERHLQLDRSAPAPPLLVLAGEPGIGKTRLLQEAAARGHRAGWRVLRAGCARQGGQAPYAPLLQALHDYIMAQPAGQLRSDLRGCAWLVRLLPELAAGPIEPLPAWTLTPDQERRLMFAAVGRFLHNTAAGEPHAAARGTLLVLDDVQWAGGAALDLLLTLLRDPAGRPLRVVAAYRDSEVPPASALATTLADLAHAGLATHHSLEPLAPPEANTLLSLLLADGQDLQMAPEEYARLRERLLRRAGGVPFFLVSCAQEVQTETAGLPLSGRAGEAIPWTLAQGIRQRVAALPDLPREVLGVAAVVGREAARPLVTRVTARSEHEVLAALEAACDARLLEETEGSPGAGTGYRFVHDVIREVVEAGLGAGRRTWLHGAIAGALEETATEPPVEALAYHYAQTEDHARAAHWLERAGDDAAAVFANAAAVDHYAVAWQRSQASGAGPAVLSRLDEKAGDLRVLLGAHAQAQQDYRRAREAAVAAGGSPARRIELWLKEAATWHRQGQFAQALAALAAAEAEGGADGPGGVELPERVQVAIHLSRAEVLLRQRPWDAAAVALERAVVLLDSVSDGTAATALLLARAAAVQGMICHLRGDLAGAVESYERSVHLKERAGDQGGLVETSQWLARALWGRGDFAGAASCLQRAQAVAERIGDQENIVRSWAQRGHLAYIRGDLAGSDACTQRGLALAERLGSQVEIGGCLHGLARVALKRGDLALAQEHVQRSLRILEEISLEHAVMNCQLLQGHTALAQGALAAAAEYYESSLATAEEGSSQSFVAWNCFGLGHVALARGDLIAAEEQYRRALATVEHIGQQPGLAGAWANLGAVACERGELQAATQYCRAARHLARRIGAADVEALATVGQARARQRAGRLSAAAFLAEHACALAAAHELAQPVLLSTLLLAEVRLEQGAPDDAQTMAEEALRQAMVQRRRREEAVARRLLGRCAQVQGNHACAEEHVRTALAILDALGMALEASRSRLVLAHVLVAGSRGGGIPDEAGTLLTEAQAVFKASGAALDLAQAEKMQVVWGLAEADARPGRRASRQAWVLEHLRTAGPISPRAYAQALDVSVDTALLDLRELVQQGRVRADGTTKDRRYLLRDDTASR